MGRWLGGVLGNESSFGRLMSLLWVIIASSVLFALLCLPVITVGPALCALYYVMLKYLHSDRSLSPVRTFAAGFRQNLRQAIPAWLLFALLEGLLVVEIRFCRSQGGVWQVFLYALIALLLLFLILGLYLAPVMAAFSDTLPHLLRNALFFASRRPLKIPVMLAAYALPVLVTVLDERNRPLWGFLWVVALPGAIALLTARLLLRDIETYLPSDAEDAAAAETAEARRDPRKVLREMKKLDR